MKREVISNAINGIDSEYIEEAASMMDKSCKRNKFYIWEKVGAMVACLAIVAVASVGIYAKGNSGKGAYADIFSHNWPDFIEYVNSSESTAKVKTWDEKNITEKYWIFQHAELTFTCRNAKVDKSMIGSGIGSVTLSGTDEINKINYDIDGEIYSINGINEQCALAVKFEEDSEYYVYVNSYYKPETLGEFIEVLSLRENASFGDAYCLKWAEDGKTIDTIRFSGIDDEYVWNMLLDNTDLENVKDYDKMMLAPILTIGVDVPILGYKNISIGLTADGYLTTNILDTGKAFFIGKDKVDAFLEYVYQNCEGQRIVYEDLKK